MGKAHSRKRTPAKAIESTRFYQLHEVCDALGVSIQWLRDRRREGLPAVELKGRVWIEGSDLIEYLRKHKRRAGQQL